MEGENVVISEPYKAVYIVTRYSTKSELTLIDRVFKDMEDAITYVSMADNSEHVYDIKTREVE